MIHFLLPLVSFISWCVFTCNALAQAGAAGNSNLPVNSPEPATMLALAGGAAIAYGVSRRRKNNDE